MPDKALWKRIDKATKEAPEDQSWTVYVLSQVGRNLFERPTQGSRQYYTGVTTNLKKRIKQHNEGKTTATRGIEWEIVDSMPGFTKKQAYIVEKFLKRGDTLGKRAEFYAWCHMVRTEEKTASLYWSHIYPRLRNLAWFNQENV